MAAGVYQRGVPGRQAKAIWYLMSVNLDVSNASSLPVHGLIMDIRKAFNALPRLPLWAGLLQMGFPPDLLHTWAAFVAGQVRRFQVRQSLGGPSNHAVVTQRVVDFRCLPW